jgi:hypothetical protein
MALRREILSYVGTGAIGSMVGYYVGVKRLLGLQSEQARANRGEPAETETPTATETETPTATETETPTATETETPTTVLTETQVSFEDTSVGAEEPADPWGVVNDPYPDSNSVEISDQYATHGSQTLHMSAYNDLDYLLVGVRADMSDVATVLCDTYLERSNHYNGFMNLGSWDGDEVNKRAIGFQGQTGGGAGNDVTGEFTNLSGDVSEWTGNHILVFNVQGDNEAYFDNLRFLDETGEQIRLTELNLRPP